MKKLSLIIAAVAMSFMLFSCGGVSTKDAIINDVDNYFNQLEQKLGEINNAEDFLAFAEATSDRSDLVNLLQEKYGDKTLSDEDNEAVQEFIQERATTYNQAEAKKAAEFLTPLIEDYENAVNALYDGFNSDVDPDTFHALTEAFEQAETALRPFAEYDNVLPELQQRAQAAAAKLDEILVVVE